MAGRVEFTFKLNDDLPCHHDVLGKEFEIVFGGIKATLAFPVIPKNAVGQMLLASPLNAKTITSIDTANFIWGRYDYAPIRHNAWVKHLQVWFHGESCESIMLDLGLNFKNEFNKWFWRFKDFLEIITSNVLRERIENERTLSRFKVMVEEFNSLVMCNPSGLTSSSGQPKATCHAVSFAIALANSGRPLKIEYHYLREARDELQNQDYRRAVLDAATASEISITNAIRDCLFSTVGDCSEMEKYKYRTLSGRLKLAEKLEIELPSGLDFNRYLIYPRNEAIHEGSKLGYGITCEAVNIATKILQTLSPLVAVAVVCTFQVYPN